MSKPGVEICQTLLLGKRKQKMERKGDRAGKLCDLQTPFMLGCNSVLVVLKQTALQ